MKFHVLEDQVKKKIKEHENIVLYRDSEQVLLRTLPQPLTVRYA